MTQSTRAVTYTLASRTSGVPGLEKFASSLERIRAVQDQIKRQGDVVAGLRDKTVTIRMKFEAASINAELARIQNRTVNINVKVGNLQAAQNDINTLNGLLSGLSGRTQYSLTVNVTALTAVHANINTQITQLQSLIAQLRALGNSGGPGGGGRGGAGGPSGSTSQLLSELTALNNQWKRNEIDAAAFGAALVTLQGKLRTAASGAQAGTVDFRALDAGLTRLTTSLRSINTDAFQKIRTDAGAMRGAFDAATAGVTRNSQQFRTAVSAYETSTNSLIARLQALASSGTLTTTQLGQVNREMARLAREANTIAGGVNAGGLSGNIFNALRAGFPIIGQMGGALGAAAGQAGIFGSAIGSAAAAFGPLGIAIGVTTVAVGLLTAGIMSAVNEYGKFEAQMQGVKAVSDATGGAFKGLKDQAKNLALEFGLNVNQIGQVQEELFKAGRGIEDVMGGAAKAVTVLMRATGSDLNNAVAIAGASMNTFNIQGSNMMRVADAIANGANKTALDVNTLGVALQQVGNVASGAGLSLEETVALLGLMADRGIRGSDAGTSLKVMMQRLTSGMPEVIAGLDKFNISVYDGSGAQRDMIVVLGEVISAMDKMTDEERGAFLQKVAGSDAQRVLTASYQAGTSSLKDYIAMMDDRGRAERDAKTRMEGLQGAQAKLNTTFQIFKDTVGEVFAPAVTTLVNAATAGVSALTDLFKWLDQLDRQADEVEKTALGKELETLRGKLEGERSQLRGLQSYAEKQPSAQAQGRVDAQLEKVAALEAAVKVLELQVRTEAVKNGTFVGPVKPGQDDGGAGGLALTAAGADILGAMVVKASSGKLGDVSADSIVDWCLKWVRLTLNKAAPEAEAKINALFQTDSNADGKVEATDAARNLLKAGFAQRYSGVKDLQKGDVVFYTENGQNHSGIYIGKKDGVDMVRGNNRVTYEANGGKFDKYGNPISPGINPVGDVAINKLGTPNWIVRPGDMLPVLGVNPPKAKNTKGPEEEDGPITAAQIAQAQKLVAALEKATKLKADNPKDIAITKGFDRAAQDLEKFSKASEENARAVKAVQSGWEGSKKGANDYIATQADLKKYGTAALELIKQQERAAKSGSAEQIRAAEEAMKLWQGTSKARIAVTQVEAAAYQSRKAAANEAEQDTKKQEAREKEARQLAAQVAEAARQGDVTLARQRETTLNQMRENDLRGAKENVTAKLAVEQRYADKTEAAAKAVADLEYRNAMTKAAQGGAQLRGQREKEAEGARQIAYLKAEADARGRVADAQKAVDDKTKTREKEQRDLRAKYAAERRDLDVKEAQATLARTQELNRQELDAFKGTAAQRLALLKRQAQDEYNAQEQAARAVRDKAVREFENKGGPNMARNITGARQTYTDTVSAAAAKQAADNKAALQEQTKATQDARKSYSELADSMRQKIAAGKVETADLMAYLTGMKDVQAANDKLGLSQNRYVKAAQASAAALYQQGIDAQIASGAFADLAEGHSLAGAASDKYLGSVEDVLAAMPDTVEKSELYLKVLTDLAAQGYISAAAIEAVTEAVHFQAAALDAATAESERRIQMVKDQFTEGEEAGGNFADTLGMLGGILQEAMKQGINPRESGFVALLDEYIAKGGQAAQAAQHLKDNLDDLLADDDRAQDPATIAYRGKRAMDRAIAANNADTPDGTTLEQSQANSAAGTLLSTVFSGSVSDQLGAAISASLADTFSDIGAEGRETFWARFGELSGSPEFGAAIDAMTGPELYRFITAIGDAPEWADLKTTLTERFSDLIGPLSINPDNLNLESAIGAITSRIDEATASYESGATDADAYNAALVEQEVALLKLLVGLERLGPAGAAGAASVRLLLNATSDSIDPTKRLAEELGTLADEKAVEATKQGVALTQAFQQGAVGISEYTEEAVKLVLSYERQAKAAERVGRFDLGAYYRGLADDLIEVGGVSLEAALKLARLAEETEKIGQFFAKFSQTTEALGAIAKSVGGLFGEAGSQFGDAMGEFFSSGMKGAEGIARVMVNPADIQGWAQAIQGVLGYYQALGKMFDSLNPKLKAWQKSLLEVAETEKKALSLSSGGFKSPWAAQLEQDAANREKRGNAGFWKRVWWDLTGSAPEVMKTESAKLLAELQTIFAGLGEGLAGALSSSMTDAFLKGDMADFAANFEKSFDQVVGKVVLQTMVEAAIQEGAVAQDLGQLTQAIKERRYNDIPGILARIKQSAGVAMAPIAALAPSLPGYGSGGGGSSGGSDPTISPVDQRRRDELLYRYEHATDPAEKERLRKELLGLDPSSGGGGTTTISAAPVKTETPDWAALNAGINRLADFGAQSDQIARMEADTARMNRESAGVMAQAAGMMLLAAQGRGSSAGPGNINF